MMRGRRRGEEEAGREAEGVGIYCGCTGMSAAYLQRSALAWPLRRLLCLMTSSPPWLQSV